MSKKGQDNQRGIKFQNKTALLCMLDSYKYSNFLKIKFEDDEFEDFTLFFSDIKKTSTFFYEYEIKNWKTPLILNDVKKIIRKEVKKGVGRYADRDRFFIVAPSFDQKCKDKIFSFKNSYFFSSYKDFNSTKDMYKKIHGDHPILNWDEKEIAFIDRKVALVELDEENIDKQIMERFYYEQPFFYTDGNRQNIISRFFTKITEKSSAGGELTKQEIRKIITGFCNEEAKKSESYDPEKDLGSVTADIKEKLQTEDDFNSLNDSKYITPISKKERVIFYIADELKNKQFQFKKIKWFFEEILIKDRYVNQGFDLLKEYAEKNNLDHTDKNDILEFILKLSEYEPHSSLFYQQSFNLFYRYNIFKIILKLSETSVSENFKQKVKKILDKTLPSWSQLNQVRIDYHCVYRILPKLIKNIFDCSKDGIEFIFKKYDFTKERNNQIHIPDKYIEEFINKNFKTNFKIIVKEISNQFQSFYKKQYNEYEYTGYELSGGGYSGIGGQIDLHTFQWESLLGSCIKQHYEKKKDHGFLKSIINIKSPVSKDNPVFVRRSCIPFLLQQLRNSSEEDPKRNIFYEYLEFILKIKEGLPRTEDIAIQHLYREINIIPDTYLNLIIRKILCKYSETKISAYIPTVKFIVHLIARGKMQFKEDLKKILLDKKYYRDDLALRLLEREMENQNIKKFFNEIKDELDLSQNTNLLYINAVADSQLSIIEKLFKSPSKKDLDSLVDIIGLSIMKNNHKVIKKILILMEDNLLEFYKRASVSNYLMRFIAQIARYAPGISNNEKMAEDIINMCINNTDLCGESEELKEQVIEVSGGVSIQTMRAELCYSIDDFVIHYRQGTDTESFKKLETAFSWIKTLMDLDGILADKISGFPKPNYYLRYFAVIPFMSLSYRNTRQKLNKYKSGLGDEIKNFAFSILEQTEKEIKENNSRPDELLKQISLIFNIIRDLDENEAKKVLCFMKEFEVLETGYLFIYYALFREKHFEDKGQFKSCYFQSLLNDICKGEGNILKQDISFTIYKTVQNKDEKNQQPKPNFEFFEQIKDSWVLLFENFNKNMWMDLINTLAIILNHNKSYYDNYKKYLFKLIKQMLKNEKNSDGVYFLLWDEALKAVSKFAPDDLIEILFFFLKEGDPTTGWTPFNYEVTNYLIPQIKKHKDKITVEKIEKAIAELKNYSISL